GGDSTGFGGSGFGGGINNDVGGLLVIRDTTFLANQTQGGVHGKIAATPFLSVGNGAAINNEATLVVRHSTFASNRSQGGAGLAGVAGGNGGAGAIKSGSKDDAPPVQATVSDCTFIDNRAMGGPGGAGAVGGQGPSGAFLADHGTAVVSGCRFFGNQAIG